MDRLFMRLYLPEVDKYLHYRIVDVSTIKELCRYVSEKFYLYTMKSQWCLVQEW
jgi:oligoribonuclease